MKDKLEKQVRSYIEQKTAKRYIVITLNCEILGIWGNLKKACDSFSISDIEFPQYKKLIRIKENPIKFETSKGSYIISIEKPK